jgi:hypothetical protein
VADRDEQGRKRAPIAVSASAVPSTGEMYWISAVSTAAFFGS